MFDTVLIANRGAIATRAERTLARMGVRSVAVYAEADKDSLHVEHADVAISLGEGGPKETYLDADKVLAAAHEAGAQAIFPGYGFLSENAPFARRCQQEGIAFVGPSPKHIEDFGLKHVARRMAEQAQVPLAPGTALLETLDQAQQAATQIGYPVMLKSTAGGGGIGISICRNEAELGEAFLRARHLAQANFGNSGVFLEKYVEHARHIEVQVFGAQGTVAALGERDCSVQRRNQKVVEECPAPNLPQAMRARMLEAAKNLAQEAGYASAGTVEFLYDADAQEFYFLEVNTRLQVEHGITEECCGIDLVEWMLLEAAGDPIPWERLQAPRGHALEVRLYAEDCGNGFRPATGTVDDLRFGPARVETWLQKGVEVSALYDPMLAKVIVHGDTRQQAVQLMRQALTQTRVYGVTTNLPYLEALLADEGYQGGALSTRMLDGFAPQEPALEVLDGGVQATVQDYPGFTGYWAVGVPPCGPMDQLSFRVGNTILGNAPDAAGIELTLRGGSYRFRCAARICLTGADMHAQVDGAAVPRYCEVAVQAGSVLRLGACDQGMRAYLLVAGGLDVPVVLGSRSTFVDGRFGGHGGRALRTGDVIRLLEPGAAVDDGRAGRGGFGVTAGSLPAWDGQWTIGVLVGPLSDKEFLQPAFFDTLTSCQYTVNFDSARTGVRLNGPVPQWARADGGQAGLHPSNIHDNPYAISALDLTGDQPILLGPDGPSLGGFVCPVVVAASQRWKLGQLKPGDAVRFQVLGVDEASALTGQMEAALAALAAARAQGQASASIALAQPLPSSPSPFRQQDALLHQAGQGDEALCVRRSGEDALLVEYGPMKLDIALRFRVHVLMKELQRRAYPYVIDLTPGIRSLQVHFDTAAVTWQQVLADILAAHRALPALEDAQVPSRIVHLPLSWDDPQTQLAARRYQETTRPDAPWCPSNPEFIRRINGLESVDDVRSLVFDARYLVMGLGDVYLGAPVATPIDPRHRLVTTKYNPARPWTPENAVGIGGAYLCVYGMEGPGGYQFVGRTTQMWNRVQTTESFLPGKPWLLDFFDQLQFYPVSADEILRLREDCLRGRFNPRIEETTFSLRSYQAFLDREAESIGAFEQMRQAAFDAEHERWVEQGLDVFVSDEPEEAPLAEAACPAGCLPVTASVAGAVWKADAVPGSAVDAGQPVVTLESMKMEFPLESPCAGVVEQLRVEPGMLVMPGQVVAFVRAAEA